MAEQTSNPTPSTHALKVGLFLPAGEGPPDVGWSELQVLARRAEELGFDSLWLADHMLIGGGNGSTGFGVWECWSLLAGLAAVTTRIELGPLVSCTGYRTPAMLAKVADTVDEISGGRLVMGIGAGWVESEFHAFGFPFDHRVSRFEEAIQIISSLLRERHADFQGTYYSANHCGLRPPGPRPQGPPIMVGAGKPRMLRLAARYADAWNADFGTTPESIRTLNEAVDAACREVGRDPATLARSASITVDVTGPSLPGDEWIAGMWDGKEFSGSPEELAATLRRYSDAGISHVQVWLNPNTVAGIEAFAPVLDLID